MPYLVLARKWRPQRFEDIVGQGHITRVLRNAIRAGRIAHAYLFTGVRGVGKTTAARILAKALNCEKGPTPEPCGECSHCLEIAGGNGLDVYEIDGASNRGIDEVRQIIENVRYQPAKSRFKIYIVDEVHQVTKDAFNALLKTLEEPPQFVKFILATTEPHRLPDTILSRCQRYDFRRITVREIIERLRLIAAKEDLRITEGALLLLAREAEGSMRDAQSLLEQVLAYAAPAAAETTSLEINEQLLQDILGIAERGTLYDLSAAVIRENAKRCVELVADVVAQGRDIARLSRELVEHFRNLLVASLVLEQRRQSGEEPAAFGRLLDLPDQEIEDLRQQVSGLSVETLMEYFKFMAEGDEEVGRSPFPRFALETVLVRLAIVPKLMPVGEVLERLERLEGKLSEGGQGRDEGGKINDHGRRKEDGGRAAPSTGPHPFPLPQGEGKGEGAAERPAHEGGGSLAGDNKTELWKQFVAFVTRQQKMLGTYLEQVYPLELAAGQLRIGAEDRHYLNYLQDPENLSAIKGFARQFFSHEMSVAFTPAAARKRETRDVEATPAGAVAGENEDVVQETLKIFGGTIVKKDEG